MKGLAICIALIILLADFTSKWLVHTYIPFVGSHFAAYPYNGIGVFNDFLGIQFAIIHNINQGAAWGVFSQWQDYLVGLRIVLIIGLIVYFFTNKHRHWEIPLACLMAGAIGNVVDYFVYGHVIDMLHFTFWGYIYPTFNIADASIFMSIVTLFFLSWKEKHIAAERR